MHSTASHEYRRPLLSRNLLIPGKAPGRTADCHALRRTPLAALTNIELRPGDGTSHGYLEAHARDVMHVAYEKGNAMTSETFRPKAADCDFYSTSELKKRGWTERLIQKYLPEPDSSAPNPYRRTGAPKRLYRPSKVHAIEAADAAFRLDKARSDGYSDRLQVQSDAKRLHLELLVRGIPLPALTMEWGEVRRQACELRLASPINQKRSESELALEVLLGTMESIGWHLGEFMCHSGILEVR